MAVIGLVSDILLRITGTSDDARRALREVAAEVAAFNAVDAEVRIRANPKDALLKIAEVEAALRLIGGRKVSVDVKVEIDSAKARLRVLKAELEHALKGGTGSRPVAAIAQDIAQVGATVASLGAELTTLGAKAGGALASIGGAVVSGITSVLASVAGGLVTIAATIAIVSVAAAILVPIIVALSGVLLALVASLAAAAVGLGALLTAGIFAAIPVFAVAAFAIIRLVGAVKALQSAEKNRATVAKQLRDADQAHTQAIQAKKDATENLARTQIEASKAERDAILAVRDAQLSLAESKLGIQDADIALERAQLHLKELGSTPALGDLIKKFKNVDLATDPKKVQALVDQVDGAPGGTQKELDIKQALLDVAHAQLGIKEAKQREVHATNDLADANKRNNEFVRDGIRAYQPYVAALKSVADAELRLRDTTEAIADVRKAATKDTGQFSAAELTAGQAVLALWETVKKAMQPLAGPVSAGVLKLFQGINDLASDSSVHSGLKAIGEALGDVLSSIGGLLSSKEVVDIFADLARTGATLTRTLGKGVFEDLLIIFLRIAHAAAPALIDLFERFGRFLHRIAGGTKDAKSLRGGVQGVIDSFKDWLDLAYQVGRVIANLFGSSKEKGDSLVRTFTRLVKRFADFLGKKEGREAVKQFLDDSFVKAKKFWHQLVDVYDTFKTTVGVVNALAFALERVYKVLDKISGPLKRVAGAIGKIAGGDTGGGISGLIGGVDDALNPVGGLIRKLTGRAHGGFVNAPHSPGSDNVMQPLSGGEYVLNAAVTGAIGLPRLNALNSGAGFGAAGSSYGGGGGNTTIEKQEVILPPAPGHDQMGDARHQARDFAKEMRRGGRGRGV